MICAGDEQGRTQQGNNNAYCQDSPVTWHDWSSTTGAARSSPSRGASSSCGATHPALAKRASFFAGREIRGVGLTSAIWSWFRHDGEPMTDEDWQNPTTSSLGVFLPGSGLDPVDEEGRPQHDDDLVIILNASGADIEFTIPTFVERGKALAWELLVDTADDAAVEQVEPSEATRKLVGRSLKLFGRRALGPGGLQARSRRADVRRIGCSCATASASTRRGRSRATWTIWASAASTRRRTCGPRRAARTATTSSTTVRSTRSSAPTPTSAAWTDALAHAKGMQHVLVDFVPNHMGIGSAARTCWWNDVLENGPSSEHAEFFDIDWRPPASALSDKILLPVLGRQFGQEVDAQQVSVRREGGALRVRFYDRSFPASPRSYVVALEGALDRARAGPDEDDPARQELESILGALRNLPAASTTRRPRPRGPGARAGGHPAPPRDAVRGEPRLRDRHRRGARRHLARPRSPGGVPQRAALPPQLLARGHRGDQLPPLLRHQRARGCSHGGAGRLRGGPRARPRHDPRRAGHRAAPRSHGRPVRSRGLLPGAAGQHPPGAPRRAAARGVAHVHRRREDPRVGRAPAPRLGDLGHHGVRFPRRGGGDLHRRGRRARDDAPLRGLHRRSPRLCPGLVPGQARRHGRQLLERDPRSRPRAQARHADGGRHARDFTVAQPRARDQRDDRGASRSYRTYTFARTASASRRTRAGSASAVARARARRQPADRTARRSTS